jgi:hypothetical protein
MNLVLTGDKLTNYILIKQPVKIDKNDFWKYFRTESA